MQAKDPLEHAGIIGVDRATAFTLSDQDLQIFGRGCQLGLGRRLDPDRPYERVPRAVQDVDDRRKRPAEDLERTGDSNGCGLRLLDRDGLGRELTDHDVKGRDDDEGDDRGRDDRRGDAQADRFEDGLEQMRKSRFAEPTKTQACKRDPELAGRQITVNAADLAFCQCS